MNAVQALGATRRGHALPLKADPLELGERNHAVLIGREPGQ